MNTGWIIILFLSVFIIGLSGCYEPREGCLDIRAINFDVDADEPCGECCEYPAIQIAVQHRFTKIDTLFNFGYLDSVYYDKDNDPFRVNRIRFYLSGVRLVHPGGEEEKVTDSIEVEIYYPGTDETSVETIEDNFALVNADRDRTFNLGTFAGSGEFTSIKFNIGVEGLANQALPASFPDTHPLTMQDDPMYWSRDSGYVFNQIEILRDTVATDTIPVVLEIGTPPNLKTFELGFPEPLQLDFGFNPKITLQIDYALWFDGIDIQAEKETLISTIVQNIAKESFSVIAVEQE